MFLTYVVHSIKIADYLGLSSHWMILSWQEYRLVYVLGRLLGDSVESTCRGEKTDKDIGAR